ncbi:hypothetical protein ACJD0Z_16705 [Flavobacteriaceae bacterium M23B6Z8]
MKDANIISSVLADSFTSFAKTPVVFHDGIVEDVFKEDFYPTKINSIPAAIKHILKIKYPKGKISNAFVNGINEYKLELVLGRKSVLLYLNQFGIRV